MEGDRLKFDKIPMEIISIHALRMEGDDKQLIWVGDRNISIHALRMEGDRMPAQFGGVS